MQILKGIRKLTVSMPVLYPRELEMFDCPVPVLLRYILVFVLSTKELKNNIHEREKMGVREEQRNSNMNVEEHALIHWNSALATGKCLVSARKINQNNALTLKKNFRSSPMKKFIPQ